MATESRRATVSADGARGLGSAAAPAGEAVTLRGAAGPRPGVIRWRERNLLLGGGLILLIVFSIKLGLFPVSG